jgi:hypothetical protein
MVKTFDDIIHNDVELTAETVVPAEGGFACFAELYGEPPCDGPPAVTKIPVMTDDVTALCMLTQALAVAFDMGMMTRDEVDCVVARVAKAAARCGR